MVTVPTDHKLEVICLVVQLDILHTLTMVCVFVCVCRASLCILPFHFARLYKSYPGSHIYLLVS